MSEQCNLNCSYCGMDKLTKQRIDANLLINQVYKLIDQNPDEIIRVDFFGGEPLIQFDIIEQVIETFKDYENIRFKIPTNGLLLTEEKLKYLKEHDVEISLSFDGLWQDQNRLQFNDKGTLHKYLKKKHLFRGLKCHTMVTKGNYNLLENHLFIMNEFGLNPELTLVRDLDVWDSESIAKLKEGITEIFEWYVDNTDKPIPNFILFYLRHFLLYHNKGVEVSNCGAGKDLLTFSENRVLPCNRFKDNPEMVEKIPEFYQMEECQKCEVRYYCTKGCLFEQIKNNGPIAELCDVYKYIYKQVSIMTKKLSNDANFNRIILEELQDG